ncbi:hypothetical protein K443DRAFT_112491, partial [Laccaria amethystina LaAM-08-1]
LKGQKRQEVCVSGLFKSIFMLLEGTKETRGARFSVPEICHIFWFGSQFL